MNYLCVNDAVLALQFEDIAIQLVARIDARLARATQSAPTVHRVAHGANPIHQTHMAQGSAELF